MIYANLMVSNGAIIVVLNVLHFITFSHLDSRSILCHRFRAKFVIFTANKRSGGKVMFSQVSVSLFTLSVISGFMSFFGGLRVGMSRESVCPGNPYVQGIGMSRRVCTSQNM